MGRSHDGLGRVANPKVEASQRFTLAAQMGVVQLVFFPRLGEEIRAREEKTGFFKFPCEEAVSLGRKDFFLGDCEQHH